MKVILYMAMTPNGMIATEDDDTSWVSENEWKSFSGMIKRYGNMVIGRRTYEIMLRNGDFNKSDLNGIKTVVLTSRSIRTHDLKSVHTAKSPREALNILKEFKILMDEIYLDIEPIAFGKGVRLFSEANFSTKLKLVGTRKLSKNEIQLHYKVIGAAER